MLLMIDRLCRPVCVMGFAIGMMAFPSIVSANRSRQEVLDARDRVRAGMEVVAFYRVANVMEKQWDGRGGLTGTRELDRLDLQIGVVRPENAAEGPPRPAVIFFHGGGFHMGSPSQFFLQAEMFAACGAVAFCPEYRLKDAHEVTIAQQVEDARSAIRWVRRNATALHVDPKQIIAAGGSAGGYLALASAVLPNSPLDSVPNALVLFNPAIDFDQFAEKLGRRRMEESLGGSIEAFSATPNLRAGLPPMILFHGEDDEKIPIRIARRFADRARELNIPCELVVFPGEGHGFFNRDPFIEQGAARAITFLQAQGLALQDPD